MITIGADGRLEHAEVGATVGPFHRLQTSLRSADADGTVLAEVRLPGHRAAVEWLYPFSWDIGDRGVITATRTVAEGARICLHAGPYGTADAVAHRDGVPMEFPTGGEGHRYRPDSALPPQPDDDHQDASAWLGAAVGSRCLVLGWEYSGHLTSVATVRDGEVVITVRLPADTFRPGPATRGASGPIGWVALVDGGLDEGAAALRRLAIEELITEPDLSGLPGSPDFPCLVANSWGVLENTSTDRILAMMDATAAVGAEVFVVDKGWERHVGDWHANDRFPSGLRWLSDQARSRGMGFGVWCGWGNADRAAPVAREHPEWLATWRGSTPALSFDNPALCLGHDPARDWVLAELSRMVEEFSLDWLLHDFETIARCDSASHTHDPGAGEHAAEAAFHHVLVALAARFPRLVLENCWNGVRPLDLAMVRHHHTTITEDHCRTRPNSLAKVGLGRYLPLDWQSAYMGVDELPTRARIAPYVVGGPWVLMDDPELWTADDRASIARATAVYREWRSDLRQAEISRPTCRPGNIDPVVARCADGRLLVAVSVPPGTAEVEIELGLTGTYRVTDEWTGSVSVQDLEGWLRRPTDPAGDGVILSLRPA
jgi:hypothetical protein